MLKKPFSDSMTLGGLPQIGIRAMINPDEPEKVAEPNEPQGLHRTTNAYVN